MNINVGFEERELKIGTVEGRSFVNFYWNGGIDSCFEKTITVKCITVTDKELAKVDFDNSVEEFIVLDNGKTVNIKDKEYLYNYFMYGEE